MCPPALCAAILRGIAAQHLREGEAMPTHVERRLGAGRAVYNLNEARADLGVFPPGDGVGDPGGSVSVEGPQE
eukprot:5615549-Alexandrium_andersonii.AAC.1